LTLGLATGIAGLTVDGPTGLAVAGVRLAAAPAGTGLLRRLGFVSREYSGPQWPFLFTFGKRATGWSINRLRRALRAAHPH
jgi:hypothetical protein